MICSSVTAYVWKERVHLRHNNNWKDDVLLDPLLFISASALPGARASFNFLGSTASCCTVGSRIKVLKDTPLPDTPLIFSIRCFAPLLLRLYISARLISPPPPLNLATLLSFWLFFVITFSLLSPGKWHRIPLSAAKANLFIITIYLLLYVCCSERHRKRHCSTCWLHTGKSCR